MIENVRLCCLAAAAALAAGLAWQVDEASAADAEQTSRVEPVDRTEAEGIIFERQQIMLQLEEEAKTLGEVAAGSLPTERMAPAARAIADLARESIPAFEPNVPGGRGKPEIWTNWSDYSARMKSFADNSEKMAKAAEAGDTTGAMSLLVDALPCKQCHDVYRTPKKRTS